MLSTAVRMSPLARLIAQTRADEAWQLAVRHQRLLERLADPSGIECPCRGRHQAERLSRALMTKLALRSRIASIDGDPSGAE